MGGDLEWKNELLLERTKEEMMNDAAAFSPGRENISKMRQAKEEKMLR